MKIFPIHGMHCQGKGGKPPGLKQSLGIYMILRSLGLHSQRYDGKVTAGKLLSGGWDSFPAFLLRPLLPWHRPVVLAWRFLDQGYDVKWLIRFNRVEGKNMVLIKRYLPLRDEHTKYLRPRSCEVWRIWLERLWVKKRHEKTYIYIKL